MGVGAWNEDRRTASQKAFSLTQVRCHKRAPRRKLAASNRQRVEWRSRKRGLHNRVVLTRVRTAIK